MNKTFLYTLLVDISYFKMMEYLLVLFGMPKKIEVPVVSAGKKQTECALIHTCYNSSKYELTLADVCYNSSKYELTLAGICYNSSKYELTLVDICYNSSKYELTLVDICYNSSKSNQRL